MTLEPSRGGMGKQLNTASIMLIQTLATNMLTSGVKMGMGRKGTMTKNLASRALATAVKALAPGPARATSNIPFCGFLK